jgi:nitroimidazol reductase NimA-like FMN-containing flavoprotein (pyridoxamine 5'-phosphate oxidase superfamily)
VKRHPERAVYDHGEVLAILDEGFVCHIGFVAEGHPQVLPTAYGRIGNHLYIHGSAASHMLRSLAAGIDLCVTVTLIDGLVLARSTFRHSINYRSVVLYGKARLVTDPDEKMRAMESFVNHVVPGRWEEVRTPSEREMAQTSVLALPIDEAVAKQRKGWPNDAPEDISPDRWAGVIPIHNVLGTPLADAHTRTSVEFDLSRFDDREGAKRATSLSLRRSDLE